MPNCGFCNINAELKCSGCKSVYYCSNDHQKKHWKTHKTTCRPFELKTSQELGRYLIATRDIEDKSVIFTETPIIVGPDWSLDDKNIEKPFVPCVGCFNPISIGGYKCPRCTWPACSPHCEGLENPLLHGIECPILGIGQNPNHFYDVKDFLNHYRSDALFLIKSLLLQRHNAKKWQQLINLQSNENERKNTEQYHKVQERFVDYLNRNYIPRIKELENHLGKMILQEYDEKTIHRICGIIDTNAMYITLPNDQEIGALYSNASMLQHSCIPNCIYTFNIENNFKIIVHAGRHIKKGEQLSIMYTNMLWGTQLRNEHLLATKYFQCKCQRCTDPTELNTYISGLKCFGQELITCGGVQLPKNVFQVNTDWGCNKCPVVIANNNVKILLENITEEVDRVIYNKTTNIKLIEELIDKLLQFLHKNHYHIFMLKHTLIQLYGHQEGYLNGQLSDTILNNKITMCNDLLNVIDIIDPHNIRLAIYTCIILYELNITITEIALRKMKANIDKKLILNDLMMAKEYLQRGKDTLKYELDMKQCRTLYDRLIHGEEKLEDFINNLK